jgi:hypothetical protein
MREFHGRDETRYALFPRQLLICHFGKSVIKLCVENDLRCDLGELEISTLITH